MKRYQIVPPSGDGKDIGWFWIHNGHMQHWFRSRKGTNLAISHCGLVYDKNKLEFIKNIPLCNYCLMIEKMRETASGQADDAPGRTPDRNTLKNVRLDYSVSVRRAFSMKESRG